MLQIYRPSNRVSISGVFFFLLLTVLCGGLVFGGLAFGLSRLIWLIIVFPIGLGIGAGAILAGVITRHRIRNPTLAVAAGLLMGLVIYGTMHYGDYLVFQSELRQIVSKKGALTTEAQDILIDLLLTKETGTAGFFGYLKLMAQEGVSIGKVGAGSKATLPEPLTWAYWLIELGIIGAIAAIAGREAARKPFCETCQQWYHGGAHLGSASPAVQNQLLGYVQSGDFRQTGALISKESVPSPSLEIYTQRCLRDQEHASVLTIRHASLDAKGKLQFKDLLTAMIAPHEVGELLRGQVDQNGAMA